MWIRRLLIRWQGYPRTVGLLGKLFLESLVWAVIWPWARSETGFWEQSKDGWQRFLVTKLILDGGGRWRKWRKKTWIILRTSILDQPIIRAKNLGSNQIGTQNYNEMLMKCKWSLMFVGFDMLRLLQWRMSLQCVDSSYNLCQYYDDTGVICQQTN